MSERARRVLYVDDDEGLRRLVSRALARRGFEVVGAASGEEGLALARNGGFDVIALDHFMPGQGGFETLLALRAELPDPPPIVYVTGSEDSQVAVSALKAGAADYVVKTVGEDFFDLLERTFVQALDQVALQRRHREQEAALLASHQRLEALLREANHRVANSLQLVSAFVHMQAGLLTDEGARAALRDTQRRIEAIGQVHRRLYTSKDVESVEMQPYLEALLRELEDAWSTPAAPRHIRLDAEPVSLATDQAVSLGVVVNELVSNACKYAYPADRAGEIRVSLRRGTDTLDLIVEDDGQGMEPGAKPKGTGLGGRVIQAMAKNLRGRIDYESPGRGVRATLRMPASAVQSGANKGEA